MNNAPEAQLAFNKPPFTNTGINYFGPLTIKQGRHACSIDGTFERFGAIFTCLSDHTVCIELGCNLWTDNFINSFLAEDIQGTFKQQWNQLYRCSKRTCQIHESRRLSKLY